jgi:serine/threonine protein phosphatase PrpC
VSDGAAGAGATHETHGPQGGHGATDAAASTQQVELAILSRQGGRDYNEDACGHWHSDTRLCCVVADGAGGMGGGAFASKLVVRHIIEQASQAPLSRVDEVHDLIVDSNAQVRRHQRETPGHAQMHTTVVALFVDLARGEALWGHAGDSRLYLFRDGRMLSHTRDHSMVQSLVDAGVLDETQTRTHPKRSELQSALGTAPEHLMVGTATRPWSLQPGDAFLLCTDGLWEYVDEAEMAASLARAADPQAWLTQLEALVLRHAGERGATHHDNFSAIGVWFGRS